METATSILLVHFNPADLTHLRRLLDASIPAGHPPASIAVLPDVTAALTALTALASVRQPTPYVTLLKLDQPPAPASPAAHALRDLAALAPLIALVDPLDPLDPAAASLALTVAELGAHDCLALPQLDPATLALAIRYARERHRLHAELQAARSDLHLFAYTVAHDLKNQVFAAAGNADLLLADDGPDLTADTREMLADIFTASQHMTDLIQDLLLLSQLHTHTAPPAPVDMAAVLHDVRTRLAAAPAGPPDLVIATPPDTWPAALAYAPWVEEIWVRLIATLAGDTTPAGDAAPAAPPRVELGALAEPGNHVRFYARGPAPALAGASPTTAFADPGRGSPRTRHSLALALVRRLVTRLGGAVHAETTPTAIPPAPLTLSFTLPAAPPVP